MAKAKLKIKGRALGKELHRPLRGIKMFEPRCMVWNENEDAPSGKQRGQWNTGGECEWAGGTWWETCTHGPVPPAGVDPKFSPYFQSFTRTKRTPITEDQPGGKRLIMGYTTEEWEDVQPRMTQVPLSIAVYSAKGMIAARARGFRLPEELGYEPLCEFWDCWLPAKIKSAVGNYCSDTEAKLVSRREGQGTIFVHVAQDDPQAMDVFNREVAGVPLITQAL